MFPRIIFIAIILFVLIGLSPSCQSIVYEYDYNGEPAGDVTEFTPNGTMNLAEGHSDIDIKRFETTNGTGDNLTFTLGTKSKHITNSLDIKYVFRIFTESDNRSGYNITYMNGVIELVKIEDGLEISKENITSLGGIEKVKNEELLIVNIPKNNYIPEDQLNYFAVDGFSWKEVQKEDGNYTYIDYIHNVPGNPGTIASDIVDDTTSDEGKDEGNKESGFFSLILAVILMVFIVIVVIFVIIKRKQ
jgi:hypothetical protein